MWLDGLYVGEWTGATREVAPSPKLHPAGVVLRPEAAWGLFTGREPMRAQATVIGATTSEARLLLRAVHTSGIIQDQPSIRLDGQPVRSGTIEVTGKPGQLFGMTRLEATVVGANGAPLSAMNQTLLARVPLPVPGPLVASPFGIHLGFREPELTIAANLGYKWCRAHDASGSTKWGLHQELLKGAYAEAQRVNPKAIIVGIDTFPAQWDQAVLAAGAYPFYDVMSFHRYDHSLHAQPHDALAFEAGRLRRAQAKYGKPKPLELTEGGPDVALYQGSFFSFADEHLTRDWQRGADQYARMFLGVIAAGYAAFIQPRDAAAMVSVLVAGLPGHTRGWRCRSECHRHDTQK